MQVTDGMIEAEDCSICGWHPLDFANNLEISDEPDHKLAAHMIRELYNRSAVSERERAKIRILEKKLERCAAALKAREVKP